MLFVTRYKWLFFLVFLLVVVGSVLSSRNRNITSASITASNETTNFYLLKSPPEQPPNVFLLVDRGVGSQPGTLVHYTWETPGKAPTYEAGPTIVWLSPLAMTSNEVVLNIDTAVMPQVVQIRVYRQLGQNGVPDGQPMLLECQVEQARSQGCILNQRKVADHDIWQVQFAVPDGGNIHYIAVSSVWPVPHAVAAKSVTGQAAWNAAWIFSVRAN